MEYRTGDAGKLSNIFRLGSKTNTSCKLVLSTAIEYGLSASIISVELFQKYFNCKW